MLRDIPENRAESGWHGLSSLVSRGKGLDGSDLKLCGRAHLLKCLRTPDCEENGPWPRVKG